VIVFDGNVVHDNVPLTPVLLSVTTVMHKK